MISMSSEKKEITINLTTKRILALSILTIISFAAVWTYGMALLAYWTPTPDLSMRVNSVNTYDTGDVAKMSFSRGSTTRIKATIEMATTYWVYYYYFVSSESYRVIFTVTDSQNRPVYFSSVTGTINPGQVKVHSVDYAIPAGADTGTYTVKVYIWSDFLSSGEALAPMGGSVTFTVT